MSIELAPTISGAPVGRWKQYPVYRDSGVEWLGVVPNGWDVKRMDAFTSIFKHSISAELLSGQKVFHYSIPIVQEKGTGQLEDGSGIESNKTLITEQVLLVSKLNPRKGTITLASPQQVITVCSGEFVPLVPKKCVPKYLEYVYCSENVRQLLSSRVESVTKSHQRVNPIEIYKMFWSWPSFPEQRAIAAFLDHETGCIDALIAKKERQTELLREKRAALISHAVTKGLDSDAPMKDSGVEWLEEIPVGWAAGKTKYVATLRTGHTPSRQHPEYWRDCTIPWFSLADVWQLRDGRQEYLGETKEKISTLGLANSSAELLPANTVIVSRTASVGFSGIMPEPMATTQDFVNWVCSPKIQPEYLLYVFRSMKHEFKRLTMGSTHKTIYMPDAASFQTPVPPPGEQKQIVKYVQKHKRSLEHVEDLVAVSIEKLHEYRTALISAAVTGKIDVREELFS